MSFRFILRGIFSEEFLFSICQIRLYVTFVISHKPLHVTPRLATYDWLIGRSLYCKLLLYLTYSNMIEKTEIFSKKRKNQKFFSRKKIQVITHDQVFALWKINIFFSFLETFLGDFKNNLAFHDKKWSQMTLVRPQNDFNASRWL